MLVPLGKCACNPGFTGANCSDTEITTVHVINSCHLDIGFADSSAGIINRYFDHHFPLAISVGKQMRDGVPGYTDNKLNFMFQSWVVDAYLNCPPNMALHCPSSTQQDALVAAVKAGHITYHAFPHNAELEIMDPGIRYMRYTVRYTVHEAYGT